MQAGVDGAGADVLGAELAYLQHPRYRAGHLGDAAQVLAARRAAQQHRGVLAAGPRFLVRSSRSSGTAARAIDPTSTATTRPRFWYSGGWSANSLGIASAYRL